MTSGVFESESQTRPARSSRRRRSRCSSCLQRSGKAARDIHLPWLPEITLKTSAWVLLWQRTPFLLVGQGAGTIETAGIDYILPYWMGRYYGTIF